jgi:lipoic acid synthetase
LSEQTKRRHPEWLKVRLGRGTAMKVRRMLTDARLHTVCQSAACPNIGECFESGTATFLIMGNVCTRNCRFCNITGGSPEPLDHEEPARLAGVVKELGLRYAVVTSVTRDDLPDGGASHFAATIHAVRKEVPGCKVEVLIPDFGGDHEALRAVIEAAPDVLNHNVETVARLYPLVRPSADFERSIELLRRASEAGALTKSGLMVGLGESEAEVREAIEAIRGAGVGILSIGQYLQPSKAHLPVERYWHPEEFKALASFARALGFDAVESAPLVRSSYHAERSAGNIGKENR